MAWIYIFAGHNEGMEKLLGYTPRARRLIPNDFKLPNFSETELLASFAKCLESRFGENLEVEGGVKGLYSRILVRKVTAEQDSEGFETAHTVINAVINIRNRQTERVNRLKEIGESANEVLVAREDLLGPEREDALSKSAAWKELQQMVSLEDIIASIKSLLLLTKANRHGELQEKAPLNVTLNRLFLGGPGTGKTTVAKLYGKVLANIGK